MDSQIEALARVAAREAAQEVVQAHTPKKWLSPVEAATYLGVSAAHLERSRATREGPPWKAWGPRLIRYRVADLDAFMARLPGEGA
jgi:hypothetical protein